MGFARALGGGPVKVPVVGTSGPVGRCAPICMQTVSAGIMGTAAVRWPFGGREALPVPETWPEIEAAAPSLREGGEGGEG